MGKYHSSDQKVVVPQDHNQLKRNISAFESFAMAFGFISIATGIFTTYGVMLTTSGPMGIWTWPIVVVGQLMIALIIGALSARIPVTGYIYQWASRLTNPVFGWIMGWIGFTFLAVVLCAVDYTIAAAVLPVMFGYEGTPENAWAITAVVIVIQAFLTLYSSRLAQKVNSVAVMFELIGMVTLVVLLFAVGHWTGQLHWGNLTSTGKVAAEGYFSLGTLTTAGPWVMGSLLGAFTIVGFESAANIAEETHSPEHVVPRAMWQAVLSVGVIGMLFLIAVTALLPDPAGEISATPIADVIAHVLGPIVGNLLLVMVVSSIFACGLVIMISGSRLVWAMSRDERFPGWQVLHRVNPGLKTPVNATIFFAVIGQVILALFGQKTDALFALFGAGTLLPVLIYAVTVGIYIFKRKSLPPSKGFTLGAMEGPAIAVSVLWLAFELAIFRDASFATPWLYVAAMSGIGLVYLAWLVLSRGVKGLKMPDLTSVDAALEAGKEHLGN